MNSDIQKKLENEWKHKVRLTVEGGTFVVTNPTGTWDGDKFKKYDGTYVMNDFVVSKDKTYYFDADGNKLKPISIPEYRNLPDEKKRTVSTCSKNPYRYITLISLPVWKSGKK